MIAARALARSPSQSDLDRCPKHARTTGTIRTHPIETRWARWAYRVRIGTLGSLLPWVAIWLTIILTFFETPTWCLPNPDACRPGSELSDLYPRYALAVLGDRHAINRLSDDLTD